MASEVLVSFFASLLIFVVLDAIWLGLVIKKTYTRMLSGFKLKKISLPSALIAYILLALGVAFLVIPNSLSASGALGFGALLGLCVYGFYHFTNHAIFDNYRTEFLLLDTVWGVFACALTSMLVFLAL
jgi:uncharacterized membrane protein